MLQEEAAYGPDTHLFNPERFMKSEDELDPSIPHPDAAFGFGRRICAGQHVAEASLWYSMASLLSTFDMRAKVGVDGKPVMPNPKYFSGMIRCVDNLCVRWVCQRI